MTGNTDSRDPGQRSSVLDARNWNLPTPISSFIGRQRDLAVITRLLTREGVRLLVLTGPGGVGKTRLAIETAHQVKDAFPDGILVIDLSPALAAAEVLPRIAQAMGIREVGGRSPEESLSSALDRQQILLVLDNVEQIEGFEPVIVRLMASSPSLSTLITSRNALTSAGAFLYPVQPLLEAAPPGCTATTEAIQLFSERARAFDPNFILDADNQPLVDLLTRKLDGLPLAIELAAARLRHLPLAELVNQLDHPLGILTREPKGEPERQQTMRNAVAWSYGLLHPNDQTIFRALSVFPDGFDLNAAGAIAATDDELVLLATLSRLIDASMIQLDPRADESPRYSMLEVIRQFGLEALARNEELGQIQHRLCNWANELVLHAHQALMHRRNAPVWLAQLDLEINTLRQVLAWCRQNERWSDVLQIASRLGFYWYNRTLLREGAGWIIEALESIDQDQTSLWERAYAEFWLALLLHYQAEEQRALPLLHSSLASAQQLEDPWLEGASNLILGVIAEDTGENNEALDYLNRALDFFQLANSPANEALTKFHIGTIHFAFGNLDLAISVTDEGLRLARSVNDMWCASLCQLALSRLRLQQGLLIEAHDHLQQALRLRRETGTPIMSDGTLMLLAVAATIAVTSDLPELAARLFALEHRFRSMLLFPRRHPELELFEAAEQEARVAISDDVQAKIEAEASALSLEEAVDLALSIEIPSPFEKPTRSAGSPEHLTAREQEILNLVSEGMTNRDIAHQLYISQGTVRIHVSNILGKLGASTRTEAVRTAVRQQLISLE